MVPISRAISSVHPAESVLCGPGIGMGRAFECFTVNYHFCAALLGRAALGRIVGVRCLCRPSHTPTRCAAGARLARPRALPPRSHSTHEQKLPSTLRLPNTATAPHYHSPQPPCARTHAAARRWPRSPSASRLYPRNARPALPLRGRVCPAHLPMVRRSRPATRPITPDTPPLVIADPVCPCGSRWLLPSACPQ